LEPIKFPEANKVLRRPEGMTEEQCGDLHTHTDGQYSLSCWQMTWRERLSALLFGKVWLWVMSGYTQPPVSLEVTKTVFKKVSHE